MKFLVIGFLAFTLLFTLASAVNCKIGDHEFKAGEDYAPIGGDCMSHHCNEDGTIDELRCSPYIADCAFFPGDKTKPFPGCCGKSNCEGNNAWKGH